MSLDAAWNSENPDETLCFEFPEPVILSSPLIIARPDPAISLNLKLVGMNFEAAPTFRADNSAKPIVHVHNTGGAKLELVDLKVKGPSDRCLKIENSSDIIVQRGELKECQIGALVFGSQGIHFGAYGYQYVDADGVYIGQNKEKGISVHRSDRVTFGYNKFDINVQPEDAEAVPIFDYYNAVSLEALANAGIEKPKPMPFVPGADDYARLVIDDINEPQFLSFMYDNPPGSVQLYSTVSGEVKFVGACELGEDKKCHAHVQSEWFCPSGMMLTAIYTSSALEASSEFMTPIQCSFFVVKPQETEFVMATPSSGASGEVSVEGASVTPAAKMCTLMPKASVTYAPLMWLFLSVGVLGAVRRRHRK